MICFANHHFMETAPLGAVPNFGLVVQLVRMPPCHGGGREFESHPGRQINNTT